MKILSGPEGDGPLPNTEVLAWLRDKNFDGEQGPRPEDQIRPPPALGLLAKQIRKYIESSPAANVTIPSLKELEQKLGKFNLSSAEFLMIANIRPEAYAHLTPLLIDVYNRFDEEQLTEMLQIINETLPKRKEPTEKKNDQSGSAEEADTDVLDDTNDQVEGTNSIEPTALAPPVDDDAPMLDLDEPIPANPASVEPPNAMQVDTSDPAAPTAGISEVPAESIAKAKTELIGDLNELPAGNAATTADIFPLTQSTQKGTGTGVAGEGADAATSKESKRGDGGAGKGGKSDRNEKKNRWNKHDDLANQPSIDAAATDISQL